MDRAQFSLDELKFVIRSIYGEHVELKIHYLDGIKGRVESWVKNYIAISFQQSAFSF